jgi:hypothetical protein
MKPIATVVNNNQPDCQNIIETASNVTLPIGTPLYLDEPFAEIGGPLGGGFFAGEYTVAGQRYALVVAPKGAGEKLELQYKAENWRERDGAESDEDGLFNSEILNVTNCPAAHFCRSLNIGDHSDWYLPSRDELAMLWRNLGPRRKNAPVLFREGAAEAFETEWYWSSTEHASYSYHAWYVGFSDGSQDYGSKYDFAGVRAVRRFKI